MVIKLLIRTGVLGIVAAMLPVSRASGQAPSTRTTVTGFLSILDRGNKPAEDIGQSVIWLETAQPPRAAAPARTEIFTEGKQFVPHVAVVSLGSTVTFPNHDPFNHNVFSLSPEGRFDLGLYDRGQAKSTQFNRVGVIRVYCNVHAQMSSIILVRDNPYYAQPGADGSFSIANVPPGAYILHAWHERGGETTRPITVTATGGGSTVLQLDARGYRFTQHLNKFGQPYTQQGRRY
ncbi:MAG: hypothetical protein ABI679_01515 [Gemmatimonadota bacterium]